MKKIVKNTSDSEPPSVRWLKLYYHTKMEYINYWQPPPLLLSLTSVSIYLDRIHGTYKLLYDKTQGM